MCIRDSISGTPFVLIRVLGVPTEHYGYYFACGVFGYLGGTCLLYTSDAADERSSVDLGGRRIIKKKNG